MTNQTINISIQDQVKELELSVTKLLTLCKTLSDENSTIKESNKQLMLERSDLQSKNNKVRGQVEAMVSRLKAMDKAS